MTHPILSERRRLLIYLAVWLPGGVLIGILLTLASSLTWLEAQVVAVPLVLLYAFVCLAAWYPTRATPLADGTLWRALVKHLLAALLSSAVWQLAAGGWGAAVGRLPGFAGAYDAVIELIPLLLALGVLLYLLAVAGSYLIIAFEDSRRAETRALEAQQRQALAARELELARALQQRLLPPPEHRGPCFRLAARNLAARFVAGDFYDYFALPDGSLAIAIADVSGKGMAASLITATVKAMLPLIAAERSVTETLAALNRHLAQQLGAREFVALALARLEPERGVLELANAGLPDPYLLRPGAPAEPLVVPQPRLPLGIWSDVGYRSIRVEITAGDRILFLTDGLPEAITPRGEPLGYEAFAAYLRADGTGDAQPPGAWLDDLLAHLRAATMPDPDDDWTAVVVERER